MPKRLSIFLTLQTVLKLMMLSTDGEEGENSAGKKKRKKKKKKGCKLFFSRSAPKCTKEFKFFTQQEDFSYCLFI